MLDAGLSTRYPYAKSPALKGENRRCVLIGKSWIREQGLQDALLVEALRKRGMEDVPLWRRSFPERDAAMKHWNELTPKRDGPVDPEEVEAPYGLA